MYLLRPSEQYKNDIPLCFCYNENDLFQMGKKDISVPVIKSYFFENLMTQCEQDGVALTAGTY